jgi:hypothetical protein
MPAAEKWWEADPVDQGGGDDWWKADAAANDTGPAPPALAGRRSELRQGRAPSILERGWEAARQAIFGSEDREEAKAAGVGLQPTPADMAEAGMAAGAFFGGPAAVAPALRGAAGVVGRVGSWAAAHPKTAGAIADGAPELLRGDVSGAVMEAGRGVVGGAVLEQGGKILKRARGAVGAAAAAPDLPSDPAEALRQARALAAAGRNEEARALVDAARRSPPAIPPRVPPSAAPARAATPPPTAAAPAAAPVDRGRAVATSHNEMMAFAKKIASDDPKVGERIHLLLDSNGKPIRRLTRDEAGSVTKRANRAKKEGRKPEETTVWVKNLWTNPGRI